MREANRLPIMPTGATEAKSTRRTEFFDVEFSPCNCRGTKHKRTGLQAISVQQRRVWLPVVTRLIVWCYARVCEGCLRAWITEPKIASRGTMTRAERTVASQWWEEQRNAGRRSYLEHVNA